MKQEVAVIESQEWDDKAYSEANKFQEDVALHLMQKFFSPQYFRKKKVIDFGCGTGNITAIGAQTAKKIHGIDASENMIKHAKDAYANPKKLTTFYGNISFEHCCAEKFVTNKPYDSAVIFNCLHWIQDKNAALLSINKALKVGGQLVGNVCTSPSPNLDRKIAQQLAIELVAEKLLTQEQLINLANTGDNDPTMEEFANLLIKNNFKVLHCEEESFDLVLPNREAVEKLYYPIIMAHAITKIIPQEHHENLFKRFIDLFTTKMTLDERGLSTPLVTTVFCAMKFVP
jgi:ubiquinone/menaquinone biosynthesis C-methylase UbiE